MIKSSLTPPSVNDGMIEHYVAKGRRERSRAMVEMIRALFSAPKQPVVIDPKIRTA